MKNREKREKNRFSYLDIFFLLLLGLVFSVILLLFLETGEGKKEEQIQVELAANISFELEEALPSASDVLLDREGKEVGRILSVKKEVSGDKMLLNVICLVSGKSLDKGDYFTVETRNFVCDMKVLSVISENR